MKVAKESLPYVSTLGFFFVLTLFFKIFIFSFFLIFLLLFTLYFFRDPERVYNGEEKVVLSPADGKIIKIEEKEKRILISVFMSIFDVHINRAPLSGRINKIEHFKGRYLVALKDKASEENERLRWIIEDGVYSIEMIQIAGLVARRIYNFKNVGEEVKIGERIGMIAFGSRVDIIVEKENFEVLVKINDKVKAGITPLFKKRN